MSGRAADGGGPAGGGGPPDDGGSAGGGGPPDGGATPAGGEAPRRAEAPAGARGPAAGPSPTGHRLAIPEAVARAIARAVEEAYPREACGALLGREDGDLRRVEAHRKAANRWPDRDDRYVVDPGTLRRLMEDEERGGPTVLGFYHSHPDARPEPSATDLEHAWPWYLYLIVPVTGDGETPRAGRGRAWELDSARNAFTEADVAMGGFETDLTADDEDRGPEGRGR